MRRLTGLLTALGCFISILAATIANAQSKPVSEAPALETVDSSSATDLTGLQNRQTKLDYTFLFLPAGAGGARPTEPAVNGHNYPATNLAPVVTTLNSAPPKRILVQDLPAYAVVKPNRAIETQTDPQRLTIVAPTSQPNAQK